MTDAWTAPGRADWAVLNLPKDQHSFVHATGA